MRVTVTRMSEKLICGKLLNNHNLLILWMLSGPPFVHYCLIIASSDTAFIDVTNKLNQMQ